MKENIFNKLYSGNLKNPFNDEPIAISINPIIIAKQALPKLVDYISKNKFNNVAVVSDDNTHEVAGAWLEKELSAIGCYVSSIVIESNSEANEENLNLITAYSDDSDILLAVGGGTINDLCKLSSYDRGKEYISVPTCASVNGFSSANASIELNGVKKSVKAHLPRAIFMDLEVIANAPKRLLISGFGDCLARSTSQVDWRLSNFVLGTEYHSFPFDILKEDEKFLFDNYIKLNNPDEEIIKSLCRLLILSGLGMYIAGSSNPASQAEHLIAHYMEMFYGDDIPKTFHGEQIAVTSIVMSGIQESIIAMDEIVLSPLYYTDKPILKKFGEQIGSQFLKILPNKEINEDDTESLNKKFKESWHSLQSELKEYSIGKDKILEMMRNIEGPYTYKHLGWDHEKFEEAITYAPYIRDRFTFLDLASCLKADKYDDED
jgi:glycerol-1-phosphate dehydrogenase [NAD(P)+]